MLYSLLEGRALSLQDIFRNHSDQRAITGHAFMLIDQQRMYFDPEYKYRHAEKSLGTQGTKRVAENNAELIKAIRKTGAGVYVIYDIGAESEKEPAEQPLYERMNGGLFFVKPEAGDVLYLKYLASAFARLPLFHPNAMILDEQLKQDGRKILWLAGGSASLCETETACDARKHGFIVNFIIDASVDVEGVLPHHIHKAVRKLVDAGVNFVRAEDACVFLNQLALPENIPVRGETLVIG